MNSNILLLATSQIFYLLKRLNYTPFLLKPKKPLIPFSLSTLFSSLSSKKASFARKPQTLKNPNDIMFSQTPLFPSLILLLLYASPNFPFLFHLHLTLSLASLLRSWSRASRSMKIRLSRTPNSLPSTPSRFRMSVRGFVHYCRSS